MVAGVVAHTCNPSTWEAEAGRLQIWGQPELHSELEAILGYIETSCVKNKQNRMKQKQKFMAEIAEIQ
jgi:hypothetical protein